MHSEVESYCILRHIFRPINLVYRGRGTIRSEKVNKSARLFPILMTDGVLFSEQSKNPKQRKGNFEGVFCDFFFPFPAYHHLSTHTENTFHFESHILDCIILSHYFMRDYVFLIQRRPAWIPRAKLCPPFPSFHFQSCMSKQCQSEYVK